MAAFSIAWPNPESLFWPVSGSKRPIRIGGLSIFEGSFKIGTGLVIRCALRLVNITRFGGGMRGGTANGMPAFLPL